MYTLYKGSCKEMVVHQGDFIVFENQQDKKEDLARVLDIFVVQDEMKFINIVLRCLVYNDIPNNLQTPIYEHSIMFPAGIQLLGIAVVMSRGHAANYHLLKLPDIPNYDQEQLVLWNTTFKSLETFDTDGYM